MNAATIRAGSKVIVVTDDGERAATVERRFDGMFLVKLDAPTRLDRSDGLLAVYPYSIKGTDAYKRFQGKA